MYKLLLFLVLNMAAMAGTCTSDSYTANSANSVLTSTKYNSDHSTIYNRLAGNLDGGCISDGTLESGALNSTDFAPLLKGLHQGCKVDYSNASTVTISKCLSAVNGNFVSTATTTSAAFGCGSCSTETATTTYYVYIADGSNGTTLTPLILTTAPNADGYDSNDNKVLARFFNNSAGDIDQYSIDQWHINEFVPQETGWINGGAMTITALGTALAKGTTDTDNIRWRRDGKDMVAIYNFYMTGNGTSGSGGYIFDLPSGFIVDTSVWNVGTTTTNEQGYHLSAIGSANGGNSGYNSSMSGYMYDNNSIFFILQTSISDAGSSISDAGELFPAGTFGLGTAPRVFNFKVRVPIKGWID